MDPRLETVARLLSGRTPVRAEPGSYETEAAVAVCLRPGPGSPEVLLIRRAEHQDDPWSGHVALPGGRRDPGDASLWETAVRETLEETGLDLRAEGSLLAQLDDVHPRTPVLPSIAITPFVAAVPDGAAARPRAEVVETWWIRLSDLRRPERRSRVEVPGPSGVRTHPSIRHGRHEIWGLTHRILTQLFEILGDAG